MLRPDLEPRMLAAGDGHARWLPSDRSVDRQSAFRRGRTDGISVLFSLALLGCSEEPFPIQYQTEHLRIGTETFLCEGNLVDFENHIAFLEDDLGLEMDRTVDVYIWDSESWLHSEHPCSDGGIGVLGCYSYDDNAIYTVLSAVRHELAHAIVDNPALPALFDEGIAEGYDVKLARYGDSTPLDNVGVDKVDRATASHFVRWLRSKWGGHRLGDLARGGTRFESVYGMSLEEAQAMYLADVSILYPPVRDCDFPEITITDSSAVWSTDVRLDCTSPDTRMTEGALYTRRTLVIPNDGRYSLATNATTYLIMYRCEDVPGPFNEHHDSSDVPSIFESKIYRPWRHFAGQEVHTVELSRGRYNLLIGSQGFEPSDAQIQVWPSISEAPTD